MLTVKQMYTITSEQEVPLLCYGTGDTFDWWEDYKDNFSIFDKLFMRKYRSMCYAFGDEFADDEQDDEMEDWLESVTAFLTANDKKYHELYRIQLLEDSKLSMTENYDMTRTSTVSGTDIGTTSDGQRTDVTYNEIGQQKFTNVNKSTAFNSVSENTRASDTSENGTREDVVQYTKGREDVTHNNATSQTISSHDIGNLGVQTGADILMSYHKAISSGAFTFYEKVFTDIASEFLIWG